MRYKWDVGQENGLQSAAEDPEAMFYLARYYWDRADKEDASAHENRLRAEKLWREAAWMGHELAQYEVARKLCDEDSVERFVWVRRAVTKEIKSDAEYLLMQSVLAQLSRYDCGAPGEILFEMGAAFATLGSAWNRWGGGESVRGVERLIGIFKSWERGAKSAIVCWTWLARSAGVPKDIRLLVADLIWANRRDWSDERAPIEAVAAETVTVPPVDEVVTCLNEGAP